MLINDKSILYHLICTIPFPRVPCGILDPHGLFTTMTKRVTTFTRANDLSSIVQLCWQRPFTKRVMAFSWNTRTRGPVRSNTSDV